MNKYKIQYMPHFKGELEKIYNYIYFSLDSPLAAQSFLQKVKKVISHLDLFPEQYSKVHTSKFSLNLNLRKIPIGNYVIIYEVDNDTRQVFILHIFHGSQNYFSKI